MLAVCALQLTRVDSGLQFPNLIAYVSIDEGPPQLLVLAISQPQTKKNESLNLTFSLVKISTRPSFFV